LLMYAYSIDYNDTQAIPAALAAPMLSQFTRHNDWTAIKGGTFRYVEKMIGAMDAKLVTNARVGTVSRSPDHVDVRLTDGEVFRFDKIVIATTPEQVLQLLEAPTDDETNWFSGWSSHRARTLVHNDTGLYERRGINYFSEFDLFETATGAGYNAYLNRLSGIPKAYPQDYFLAFNLDDEIRDDCIVHEQIHKTPAYNVAALRHREEVIRSNGSNNTLFAGAWLGDGLHEGAVQSAQRVAKLLDGHELDGQRTNQQDNSRR
ncbi:MAG: FAD-dependent oxidoreductase, partial [Gammaproteobacteria bacterium]